MSDARAGYYSGLGVKLVVLATLILVLQIPVVKIAGLLSERAGQKRIAEQEISKMAGGQQSITTPFLLLEVPVISANGDTRGSTSRETTMLMVLASKLDATTSVQVEKRYRGIFESETYVAQVTLKGEFEIPSGNETPTPRYPPKLHASVVMGVKEPRFLREITEAAVDGQKLAFMPGTSMDKVGSGVHASLDVPSGHKIPFSFSFKLAGSGNFSLVPASVNWRASMTSNATEPSFMGTMLPVDREVNAHGFQASWTRGGVLRSSVLIRTDQAISALKENEIGVSFLTGVDGYRMTDRALKYSLLFVFLTFLVFYTFEVVASIRVHPVQYLLVGCALMLFYLLLLSFSEHTGFGKAYVIAAGAAVALITGYSSSVLRMRSRALTVGGLLGALYAYLYALLLEGDLALLYGSLGLTVLLGAFMYLTRHVDWYAIGSEMGRTIEPPIVPSQSGLNDASNSNPTAPY